MISGPSVKNQDADGVLATPASIPSVPLLVIPTSSAKVPLVLKEGVSHPLLFGPSSVIPVSATKCAVEAVEMPNIEANKSSTAHWPWCNTS